MKVTTMKRTVALACVFVATHFVAAQELVLDEVVVEAPFDFRLDLPQPSAVQTMIDRLTLRAEAKRAAELEIANRTPISTLLDLTKYSPIPIGGSDSRVDSYFLENHMRADLNPREDLSLFEGKR
jgi:hypothetical protein